MNLWEKSNWKGIKKGFAVMCMLCLMLSFGTEKASAEGAAKVTASSCSAENGAGVSVAIRLDENPGIWGLKLRISYDASVMTLKSVSTGSVFDSGELTLSEKLDKNPYVVLATANQLTDKTGNGNIVTLNFTVKEDAALGAYPVSVEVSQASNIEGNDVSVTPVSGTVTVEKAKEPEKPAPEPPAVEKPVPEAPAVDKPASESTGSAVNNSSAASSETKKPQTQKTQTQKTQTQKTQTEKKEETSVVETLTETEVETETETETEMTSEENTVSEETEKIDKTEEKAEIKKETAKKKTNVVPVIIVICSVGILAGILVAFYIKKNRRF